MTLDDFVLFFRDFSQNGTHQEWKSRARSLYICLALDLSGCHQARVKLKEELTDDPYAGHGRNVPEELERHLEKALEPHSLPTRTTVANCRKLLGILVKTVMKFVKDRNVGSSNPLLPAPFCCCAQNGRNQSKVGDKTLSRYVELGVFEQWYLTPGLGMPLHSIPKARRAMYSTHAIEQINGRTAEPVTFGSPTVSVEGRSMPAPAFFTPHKGAPHHKEKGQASADVIAAEMGMSDYLRSSSGSKRELDGFAVLRFEPDRNDAFFRPTILDALGHPPFRPGKYDDGKGERFRYGFTRKFKPGELRTDPARITERRGRKEVVTRVRKVLFPTDQFRLEDVRYFKP